jgi:divalent metal cation (Fe/Co/Zn/Cd) transporter
MKMNMVEALIGTIILMVGFALFWQSYNASVQCNSFTGQISTAISSIFGTTHPQACSNTSIVETASATAAVLGVVLMYAASVGKQQNRIQATYRKLR